MRVYKFPTPRYRKPSLQDYTFSDFKIAEIVPEDEELPTLIQGKAVGSKEEARVALALDILKYEYRYQYPILGGSHLRGGYIIDFVVETAPRPIPLEVQSERWHTGAFAGAFSDDEMFRAYLIEHMFGEPLRYVWGDELTTKSQAIGTVRRVLTEPVVRIL